MIQQKITTLDEFIINKQNEFPSASGELSGLLRDIGVASKIINREVNKAGLVDILGNASVNNSSGDTVQKLDMYANDQFKNFLTNSGECCGIASEEENDFVAFQDKTLSKGKYLVMIDPLDGSSNIDVNVSIGTIFSIYKRKSSNDGPPNLGDFLQKGTEQVAAGYVIYGSSTMMVYTTGNGVNGFTMDPSIGEYCLSHPDIKVPEDGKLISINIGYWSKYSQQLKDYINYCLESDPITNRPYGLRYIGSMVADIHRNMIKGGIFMYPSMDSHPNGKLRLLYECNPIAFIIEQAGGLATDGKNRILEIQPTELHQRVPVYIGSRNMVKQAMQYVTKPQAVKVS